MSLNIRLIGPEEIKDPQVLAMLQAFYSRSYMPIEQRLADLNSDGVGETKEDKIRNAMQRYYVDYGHASIGEMGGCTVFIENVSMLAAKAIQDTPLYVGQECSTRYIDFSSQPFLLDSPQEDLGEITDKLRSIYLRMLPKLVDYAKSKYSPEQVLSSKIPPEKVADSFHKTCQAIAFDLARGILPAGASTSLAWTANFRVFNDHLNFLAYHPLSEVRALARSLYSNLSAKYPSAFKQVVLNPADVEGDVHHYYNSSPTPNGVELKDWQCVYSLQSDPTNYRYRSANDHAVYFNIEGSLDFGSYRDLQRHRNGMNRMPLLSLEKGMHSFYEDAYQEAAPELFQELLAVDLSLVAVSQMLSKPKLQYLIPMGYQVPVHLYWSLGQVKYVVNLRTKTSVHPTLREFMQSLGDKVQNVMQLKFGRSQYLTINKDAHYSASDRGEQTIKERKPS